MYLQCPKCQSGRILARNIARKTCAILGTFAGAIAAAVGIGQRSSPIPFPGLTSRNEFGETAQRTANTLLSAIVGGSTGGIAGARLGAFIDDHILDNYRCLKCKHKFSIEECVPNDDDLQDAWIHAGHHGGPSEFRHPCNGSAREAKGPDLGVEG